MKCFVLIEYGGEYEDKWERIISVSFDKSKLEKKQKEIALEHDSPAISLEEFEELIIEAEESDLDEPDICKVINRLHPEYSYELIDDLYTRFYEYQDWGRTYIEECEFVE